MVNPRWNLSAKKKGMKNSHEAGTPIRILLAKAILAALSRCSANENTNAIKEAMGKAMINPAKSGRLPASQDENVMMADAIENLITVISIATSGKKVVGLV